MGLQCGASRNASASLLPLQLPVSYPLWAAKKKAFCWQVRHLSQGCLLPQGTTKLLADPRLPSKATQHLEPDRLKIDRLREERCVASSEQSFCLDFLAPLLAVVE